MSHRTTKPTKWHVRPPKTWISLGYHHVWSVFTVHSVVKGPNFPSCGQRRLWSVWAHAQAGLSLCWVHMPFYWFYHAGAQLNIFIMHAYCTPACYIITQMIIWTASSEFGTYRLCEQRRFRRACASAQSHQNLRCSLIQVVSLEEPSDRKPDPWPFRMAGHAQLKFVMTECSKTQILLTRLIYELILLRFKTILCGLGNIKGSFSWTTVWGRFVSKWLWKLP